MFLRRTTVTLLAALALGGALLAGCSSGGASTDCGLDQCTVTFQRGVEGSTSVLGIEAKFVQADANTVTLEVAGQQISLTTGGQAVDVAGLQVSLSSITDSEVQVQISR